MYIDFILTEQGPVIDAVSKRIEVGVTSDGFILPPLLPYDFVIGGLIQVSFEANQEGLFEIELAGETLGTGERRALANWVEQVPPPSLSWRLPRIYNYGFEAPFHVEHEVEFALGVHINREFVGERCLIIVQAP
jgi:hypothetical protein